MVDPGGVSMKGIGLPLIVMAIGGLLIGGSFGLTMYFFAYESDNAGALFGITVMPVCVGIGILLITIGLILALAHWIENRKGR